TAAHPARTVAGRPVTAVVVQSPLAHHPSQGVHRQRRQRAPADVRMSCLTWNSGCVEPTNSDGGTRVPDAELEYDSELVYRHDGNRFTGVGYEQTPAMRSEITYVEGLQQGPARDWSADGRLTGESYYFENTLHGWQRAYGDHGEPVTEELFLYGILVRRINHGADGVRGGTCRTTTNTNSCWRASAPNATGPSQRLTERTEMPQSATS